MYVLQLDIICNICFCNDDVSFADCKCRRSVSCERIWRGIQEVQSKSKQIVGKIAVMKCTKNSQLLEELKMLLQMKKKPIHKEKNKEDL